MLLSSKGIILQSIKYGDSSLISKVFSEKKGLISVISNRSKSKKNKFANYLQPLSLVNFVCYLSNKSSIYRLKEVSFDLSYRIKEENVASNAIRFFLAEFLCNVIKEEEQNPALFSFLHENVSSLLKCSQYELSFFHINFLIDLLDLLGISPDLKQEDLFFDLEEGASVNTKPIHDNFYNQEQFTLLINYKKQTPQPDKRFRKMLLGLLIDYYSIQLGSDLRKLKSRDVLEVVFS